MTTSSRPDLDALPALPRDRDGPLFAEPWQAQAFALAVRLQEQGHFTWSEWCAAMNEQILAAQAAGDPDLGDTYYRHWLAALETLAVRKGLTSAAEPKDGAAAESASVMGLPRRRVAPRRARWLSRAAAHGPPGITRFPGEAREGPGRGMETERMGRRSPLGTPTWADRDLRAR